MTYLELFLTANDRFLFFCPRKAEEKANKIREQGKRAEIFREKGGAWTVFEFIN